MTNFASARMALGSLILLGTSGNTQAASVYNITASAGLMLDDNISRSQYSRDIHDDSVIFASLNADYAIPVSDRSRAQLTAIIETRQHQDANLSHEIISLQGEYIFQPGKGYTAPWYSIFLLFGMNAHESEYREGSFNELGLTLGKRITDATSLRTGISRRQTSAEDEVFSLDTTNIYGNLDFKFGQNTVYTTLSFSTGDYNSTNTPPHPDSLEDLPWVNDDEAFPWLTDSWTYKLDADTWSLRLGYVHALASNQSIDASVLQYSTSAYAGNDYDGMIANIAYFYRF